LSLFIFYRAWNLSELKEGQITEASVIFRGHTKAVTSLDVCGDILYSGSADCTVRLWNINSVDNQQNRRVKKKIIILVF
jgi:WD40 repeat protein